LGWCYINFFMGWVQTLWLIDLMLWSLWCVNMLILLLIFYFFKKAFSWYIFTFNDSCLHNIMDGFLSVKRLQFHCFVNNLWYGQITLDHMLFDSQQNNHYIRTWYSRFDYFIINAQTQSCNHTWHAKCLVIIIMITWLQLLFPFVIFTTWDAININ